MKNRHRQPERGFSLLEMSMVLVIIGVMMGAVMVGTDVLRMAKGQQAFSVFVSSWRDAFAQHVQVVGRVPGDGGDIPANVVNADEGGIPLCNDAPTFRLSNVFLDASIRIPQGRGISLEDRFIYQDSNGIPHEMRVCFLTLGGWSVQGTTVNTFVGVDRHVMRITGLTAELAMQMDVLIDGNVSARFGQFRHDIRAQVLDGNEVGWGDLETTVGDQESARRVVTAFFEML